MPRIFVALLALLLAAGAAYPDAAADLDAFVDRSMREFRVPGVAVGVLSGGEVTLARGYGLRDLDRRLPVTPGTLFATGSISKSFTALIGAFLVEEGRLDWDRPVREYLPWFRLHDPVAGELLTLRDMLTHRSGLPRYDFIRFAVPLEREELVRRMRYLEPTAGFREKFQYNNLMYVAAGYLEGAVAGSTWERLVDERIFTPLGMESSNTSVAESERSPNHAKPHVIENGEPREAPFYNYQRFGVGPNGAVNSSIDDMLKYLAFQMNGGTAKGRQVLPAAALRELHTPQMVSGDGAYGLGWNIETYRGHRLVSHGGSITGFTAWIGFLPGRKSGVVVLSNANSGLPDTLGRHVIGRLLGLPPAERSRPRPGPAALRAAPRPGTKTSRELHAFAGEYLHPAFGPVRVEVDDGELRLVFPAQTVELKHHHYDIFTSARGWTVQFHMNARGDFESVSVPLEPAARPVLFTRAR